MSSQHSPIFFLSREERGQIFMSWIIWVLPCSLMTVRFLMIIGFHTMCQRSPNRTNVSLWQTSNTKGMNQTHSNLFIRQKWIRENLEAQFYLSGQFNQWHKGTQFTCNVHQFQFLWNVHKLDQHKIHVQRHFVTYLFEELFYVQMVGQQFARIDESLVTHSLQRTDTFNLWVDW